MWTLVGSLSAFLAVAAGAFGAHVLKERLSPEMLAVFEIAARYQMYHALALLLLDLPRRRRRLPMLGAAGFCFLTGTLLFSGSLYLMAFTGLRWLGAITPLGGAAFLIGWLLFAWGGVTQSRLRRFS